jgi:hypothetical protein
MGKTLGLVFASAMAAVMLCSSAQALPIAASGVGSGTPNFTFVWDDCGHGRYRLPSGRCVSNWRPVTLARTASRPFNTADRAGLLLHRPVRVTSAHRRLSARELTSVCTAANGSDLSISGVPAVARWSFPPARWNIACRAGVSGSGASRMTEEYNG